MLPQCRRKAPQQRFNAGAHCRRSAAALLQSRHGAGRNWRAITLRSGCVGVEKSGFSSEARLADYSSLGGFCFCYQSWD
jgi:hypothetical protein